MSIAGDKCDLCQLQMVLFFFFKMFQSNLRVLWEAEKIYIKFVDEREEMWGGKNVCRSCECVAAGVEWDHQSHSIKWNCLFLWPSRVLYWMSRGGQKAKPFHLVIVLPRANFKLLNFSLTLNRRRNRQNERKKIPIEFQSFKLYMRWWWWKIYTTKWVIWRVREARQKHAEESKSKHRIFLEKMWRNQGQWDKRGYL